MENTFKNFKKINIIHYYLETSSLCSPNFPRAHCVDQVGLKLIKVPPASASQVLALLVCATINVYINGICNTNG